MIFYRINPFPRIIDGLNIPKIKSENEKTGPGRPRAGSVQ